MLFKNVIIIGSSAIVERICEAVDDQLNVCIVYRCAGKVIAIFLEEWKSGVHLFFCLSAPTKIKNNGPRSVYHAMDNIVNDQRCKRSRAGNCCTTCRELLLT